MSEETKVSKECCVLYCVRGAGGGRGKFQVCDMKFVAPLGTPYSLMLSQMLPLVPVNTLT